MYKKNSWSETRAPSWSKTRAPSWSETRAPSWSKTRAAERYHSNNRNRRVGKVNSSGSGRQNYEPREFMERSQHQYVGVFNDDDSDSIDMESFLSYQI